MASPSDEYTQRPLLKNLTDPHNTNNLKSRNEQRPERKIHEHHNQPPHDEQLLLIGGAG